MNGDGELYRYPENYSPTEYMTHEQWEKLKRETKEIMAKLPSGWIFIPRMMMMNGKITIELEERKLVTCAECKYNVSTTHNPICDFDVNRSIGNAWFCADGEAKENAAD